MKKEAVEIYQTAKEVLEMAGPNDTRGLYNILKLLVEMLGPGEPDPHHCDNCEIEARARRMLDKYKKYDRYQIGEPLGGKND